MGLDGKDDDDDDDDDDNDDDNNNNNSFVWLLLECKILIFLLCFLNIKTYYINDICRPS